MFPIWKLKELIYIFGSSYKKVNTTPEEVSLYKKVGSSKMKKITFLNAGCRCNVATGGHCYATPIKTDIHLISFDRPVYWEIQLIALMLMTSCKARAPELRMITRDSY